MSFSEDELKKLAELKIWLEERIKDLELELNKMREILNFIDSSLKRISFVQASELVKKEEEYQEVIPIKRAKDGRIMANIYLSGKRLAIIPASDVILSSNQPAFKSFFINKVLEGMKSKDLELQKGGKLKEEEVFSYSIEEEEGRVQRIIIENYRDKSRLNEIINTATWTFTRVLERMEG